METIAARRVIAKVRSEGQRVVVLAWSRLKVVNELSRAIKVRIQAGGLRCINGGKDNEERRHAYEVEDEN